MPISPRAESRANESRAAKMLREIFESGRPLTYVPNRRRVSGWKGDSCGEPGAARLRADSGLDLEPHRRSVCRRKTPEAGTQSPRGVLDFIIAHEGAGIFHLKDFHDPLRESPEIRRRLRDVYQNCLDQRKFVVITSPVRFIPEELDRSMIFVELGPPDLTEGGVSAGRAWSG